MGLVDDIFAENMAVNFGGDVLGTVVKYYPYAAETPHLISVQIRYGVLKDAGGDYGGRVRVIEVDIAIGPAPNGRPTINPTVEFIDMPRSLGGSVVKLAVNSIEREEAGVRTVIVG